MLVTMEIVILLWWGSRGSDGSDYGCQECGGMSQKSNLAYRYQENVPLYLLLTQ